MNIKQIQIGVEKMKKTISLIEQLIEDYNNCKSEISKKMIETAITKYSSVIPQETCPSSNTTSENQDSAHH